MLSPFFRLDLLLSFTVHVMLHQYRLCILFDDVNLSQMQGSKRKVRTKWQFYVYTCSWWKTSQLSNVYHHLQPRRYFAASCYWTLRQHYGLVYPVTENSYWRATHLNYALLDETNQLIIEAFSCASIPQALDALRNRQEWACSSVAHTIITKRGGSEARWPNHNKHLPNKMISNQISPFS